MEKERKDMKAIPYALPRITDLEISYATDAATNGWGEHRHDYIGRFEEMFKRHLGVKYAIATSSCTGAMHMGLAALGIGDGDEVILADTNWIATVAPVVYLGAKPVFVDILKDSWCIDPEFPFYKPPAAIIATHLYGNLCDMNTLRKFGIHHGIPIIEDAAEAIGSVYHGKYAGSMATFGVFSFHGTKTITTGGEGGMFVTNNEELYERVLCLSDHGRVKEQVRQFWPERIGFKYKMSNVQAAIGCAQMERIDELVARKQEVMNFYRLHLGGIAGVSMNPEPDGCVNGYWMPTVVFDREWGVTREMLLERFKPANIDARSFFYPLSSLPMFQPVRQNKVAWDIPGRAINLPSYHDMTNEDQMRVVDVIREVLNERG
jgi:perosamine synthetase